MQDILTLILESVAIAVTFVMFLDFISGLTHLYYACTTFQENKPNQTMPKVQKRKEMLEKSFYPQSFEQNTVTPSLTSPKKIRTIDDPWLSEIEVVIAPCYNAPATPKCNCIQSIPSKIDLLSPTPSINTQLEINYSNWTIRALKKEAQRRKLSKYSALTKEQLISRLIA